MSINEALDNLLNKFGLTYKKDDSYLISLKNNNKSFYNSYYKNKNMLFNFLKQENLNELKEKLENYKGEVK